MRIEGGGSLESARGDALAVPVFAERVWGPGASWLIDRLGSWVESFLDEAAFTGSLGEVAMMPVKGRAGFRTALLVGLGGEVDAEIVRQAAGWLARKTAKVREVATTLHQLAVDGVAQAVAEGFLLGQHRFDDYRSSKQPSKTEVLRLLGSGVAAARRAVTVVDWVRWVRDLVNTPASDKSPESLAGLIGELAGERRLRLRVYDESEINAGGFGGLAAVASGAHRPPRLLELWYEPPHSKAFLALVGKGITFDSGGLSIKTAEAMETMKTDMAGAATVLAAAFAIAELRLPVRVMAITPLTENLPGGGAMRPGDVIYPRGGKSVEVLNTDAEGRLVLADGLQMAVEAKPDLVLDVATLTGAAKTALGLKIGGLWANQQSAADLVLGASRFTGERFWQMPLPVDYRKNIDSEIADIKNTGGPFGGAINAALFLREFVDDTPWVHLDIAGPARWPEDEHYYSKGGSGFGVRTLVALAQSLAANSRT